MPHTPLPGPRDWRAVFSMPARYEMNHYSNPDRIRAPYLCAWLYPPEGAIFREYSVDFRAEHVPEGTYCSLAIAAIAGIALNAILPGKDYVFGSDVTEGRSGDFGRY